MMAKFRWVLLNSELFQFRQILTILNKEGISWLKQLECYWNCSQDLRNNCRNWGSGLGTGIRCLLGSLSISQLSLLVLSLLHFEDGLLSFSLYQETWLSIAADSHLSILATPVENICLPSAINQCQERTLPLLGSYTPFRTDSWSQGDDTI